MVNRTSPVIDFAVPIINDVFSQCEILICFNLWKWVLNKKRSLKQENVLKDNILSQEAILLHIYVEEILLLYSLDNLTHQTDTQTPFFEIQRYFCWKFDFRKTATTLLLNSKSSIKYFK